MLTISPSLRSLTQGWEGGSYQNCNSAISFCTLQNVHCACCRQLHTWYGPRAFKYFTLLKYSSYRLACPQPSHTHCDCVWLERGGVQAPQPQPQRLATHIPLQLPTHTVQVTGRLLLLLSTPKHTHSCEPSDSGPHHKAGPHCIPRSSLVPLRTRHHGSWQEHIIPMRDPHPPYHWQVCPHGRPGPRPFRSDDQAVHLLLLDPLQDRAHPAERTIDVCQLPLS